MIRRLELALQARAAGGSRQLALDALSIIGLVVVLTLAHIAAADGFAFDAHAYYMAHPYDIRVGGEDAFTYSPVALLFFSAIHATVPWPLFLEVYTLAIAVGVWILAGPLTLFVAFLPQVASEITLANIHVFLALVAVAGFRWPGLWAFAILTKVTPGVGAFWFAFRGEWRKLGIVAGTTAALVLPTMIATPGLWLDWLRYLATSTPASDASFGLPLLVRLPIAVVLVFIGARRDWKWLVPFACMIALPVLWDVHGLSMLLGVLWFVRKSAGARLGRRRIPAVATAPA